MRLKPLGDAGLLLRALAAGGEDEIAAADRELRGFGVRNPERMAAVLAPGWEPPVAERPAGSHALARPILDKDSADPGNGRLSADI